MSHIEISQSTKLSKAECLKIVSQFFESSEDLKKWDPDIKCTMDLPSGEGAITGKQFKAKLQVLDLNGLTNLIIKVELPFLLRPLKGKIQALIEKQLQKHLFS
jgi:Putative polyhydroxyalkanoic acid system protein (PHA_gran_rgn)